MNDDKNCCDIGAAAWWATLVMAVLAIPSFAIIITIMTGTADFMQLAVFIIACWLCTYLGMRLMSSPGMQDKINKK